MNDIKGKYTCDACRYTFESDKLPDLCLTAVNYKYAGQANPRYMSMNIVLTMKKSKKAAVQRPLISNYYFIVVICQFPLNVV